MNVFARSLQYPHLLRRRHGDKPMFPVPRVLKESPPPLLRGSYDEMLREPDRQTKVSFATYTECSGPTALLFNPILDRRDVWRMNDLGKDSVSFLLRKRRKTDIIPNRRDTLRTAHSIFLLHFVCSDVSLIY